MAILILVFVGYILVKNIKKCGNKVNIYIVTIFVGYLIVLMFYWFFMEYILHWNYGIEGMDMQSNFDAATSLYKTGVISVSQVSAYRYQSLISGTGYKSYVYYLLVSLYLPTIFDLHVNLFLIKVTQILLCLISSLYIYQFLGKKLKDFNHGKSSVIILFLLNIALPFTAFRLLRDVWILFLIALMFKIYISEKKPSYKNFLYLLIIAVLFVLRNYSIIITLPLLFYFNNKKKLSIIVSFCATILILALPTYLNILPSNLFSDFLSTSGFYAPSFYGAFKYILSPQYISQLGKVFTLDTLPYSYPGGFLPIFYFLLSVWNLLIIPLALFGIIFYFKRDKTFTLLFLIQILNITLFYSFAYNGVSEPRHKLLIIIPEVIFSFIGLKNIQKNKFISLCYVSVVLLFMLFSVYFVF